MSAQRNPWPHIGQLFVEQGRLTSEQVEEALAEQSTTGDPLGEILVARGYISRIDLAAALSTQWTWQKTGKPLEAVPDEMPFEARTVEEPEPVIEPVPEPVAVAAAVPVAVAAPEPLPLEPAPAAPVVQLIAEPPQPELPTVLPPAPVPAPVDVSGLLESRVAALEEARSLVAELQTRLRSAYEQLAAAEARLGALEPGVSALAQAYNALNAQVQAQAHEIQALRAASVKHDTQISTAARALLG